MPGLGAWALAGAAQGFGNGIVEQAKQRREEAMRKLEMEYQQRRDEAGRQHDFAVLDRQRGYQQQDISRGADAIQQSLGAPDAEKVNYVASRLREKGYSDVMVAGLMGNLLQESNLNTGAVGDGGKSYGIGQWHKERKDALIQFAQRQGKDPSDIDVQIDFLDHELKGSERKAYDAMMQATDPEEVAQIGSDLFWRPGVPHNQNRRAYARSVYETLADPNVPESTRGIILKGMGLGATKPPAGYTNQTWVDNGDNTQTRMGYNPATQQYEPIPGPDGKPVTQKRAPDMKPTSGVKYRVSQELQSDEQTVDAVTEEVMRLIANEGLSEGEAVKKALDGMVYEQTNVQGGGWFDGPKTENGIIVRRSDPAFDGSGNWTGDFSYGDQQAPADPQMPSDPQAPQLSQREALDQARQAIAAGADRAMVIKRLQEMGIDPEGL